jgi:hypothetical protein
MVPPISGKRGRRIPTIQSGVETMGKRKLTPAEERAYVDLARAARRLRRAQERARKRQRDSRRPENRQGVGNAE